MREREEDREDRDTDRKDFFYSPEPDNFIDPDEIEEVPERGGFSGRRLRIVLLAVVLLAGAVVALPTVRSWWRGSVPPPAVLPETARSEAPAPPAPTAAAVPQAVPQSRLAPSLRQPSSISAPERATGEFWVQVGAFNVPENARRLAARLNAERYPAEVRPGKAIRLVVRVGGYADHRQAEAIRADLEKKGFTGFVLKEKHP